MASTLDNRGQGDRIRMQRHADDAGVYIRSMATPRSVRWARAGRLAMRCKSWKRPRMT
jgi:putative protein kinase ArgK-like GTPase of G3E family